MTEKYYLKLTTVYFFICIITVSLIGCGYSKLSSSEVEQNVKTFLDNKYGQDFTVKTVKFNEETTNEAHFGETPAYFNLESISNGKTYYVVYTNTDKYSWVRDSEDRKYPNSHEIIKENIEGRDWKKEIADYYSKLVGKYCNDGYLKQVGFPVDRTPSRVGMTVEEYINELLDYSAPSIYIDYAIFVDDIDSVRANDDILKKIDDGIRRKADRPSNLNNYYMPDRFFSEHFLIVSKKDKDEYIKKVEELNKLKSDYYGSSSYDRNDYKAFDEYWEKRRPIDDWIEKAEQDSCSINHDSFGLHELEQTWREK